MDVQIKLPDSLYERLTESGLLTDDAIVRLLESALTHRDTGSPLHNAYRTLFEQTHDAVFIIAPTGVNIAVNQRAVELTGYSVEELQTLSFRNLSHELDASNATMSNLLTGRKVPPYERVFRKKSGELFTAEVTAELVRDDAGNPQYIQSVVRDITQRKHDENLLRENEKLLRRIIDLAPVHIFAKDRDSRYILANRALAEAYGTTVEDMLGRMDADFTPSQQMADMFVAGDRQILETGKPIVIPEEDYIDSQGRHRILHTVKIPLKFPDRDDLAILGVSSDITELKQAEAELRLAYRQALDLASERQRVQILTQFMQDTSHEFRTPLAVMGTCLYLMTRTEDAGKRAAHGAQAAAQIERITRLLDHLQTMADLDGGIPFEPAMVNVNRLLREVIDRMPRSDDKRDLPIQTDFDNRLPAVSADPHRLGQAFEHIIDNALRFTPQNGEVTVATRADDGRVVVEVRDTGEGIPADALPHVTRRFWRLDESHTTPGFGLGLPIAQKIMERHNGTLALDSAEHAGTTVTITLPIP